MLIQLIDLCSILVLAVSVARAGGVDGSWVSDANGRVAPMTFVFNVTVGVLTGTATAGALGPASLDNGKANGDKISFEVTRQVLGVTVTTKYAGGLSGDVIRLHASNLRGSIDLVLRKK